jgi:hypothetical protein
LSYTCKQQPIGDCLEEDNILNIAYYLFEKIKNQTFNYTYTITDEDFAKAVVIE